MFEKNIIIIKNNLKNDINLLIFESKKINFILSSINKLDDNLSKLEILEREHNLLIIDKDSFTDKIKEKIKNTYKKNLQYSNPHILFVSRTPCSIEEEEMMMASQNFFYHLPNEKDTSTYYSFLSIVLQHMQDITRLNNYIVQSFKTIVDSELIAQQKLKIEKLYKQLELLSKIDVLTHVLNRRAFFEAMEKEKARTLRDVWRLERINRPESMPLPDDLKKIVKDKFDSDPEGTFLDHYGRFSCIMIDIDNFKSINDTYGHLMGDEVLKKLGELLNNNTIFRENDIVGRFGGEEFIIILPETNSIHAKIPANRLRYQIKKINFITEKNEKFNVTLSIGISEFNLGDRTCESIIDRADKALYYAKHNGKDQVVVYNDVFPNKI